jgi:hypothetical protein
MNPASIRRAWRNAFPNSLPAGFLCRHTAHERWLRTHSLPNAKRYPDGDSERDEVLFRYNAVASEVLGQNEACVLFIMRFSKQSEWPIEQKGPLRGLTMLHVMKLLEDARELQFFAASVVWKSGNFDGLLMDIANEHPDHALFFNPAQQTAFAPYDGGVDLFAKTADEACRLKAHFSAWLSSRADGL